MFWQYRTGGMALCFGSTYIGLEEWHYVLAVSDWRNGTIFWQYQTGGMALFPALYGPSRTMIHKVNIYMDLVG